MCCVCRRLFFGEKEENQKKKMFGNLFSQDDEEEEDSCVVLKESKASLLGPCPVASKERPKCGFVGLRNQGCNVLHELVDSSALRDSRVQIENLSIEYIHAHER